MIRAAPLLWAAAGEPDPRRQTFPATGRCYWCASPIDGRACKVDDVITDTFTDQDQALARSSPLLCVGCSWSMTGRPPDTLRLWSLAYREDGVPWPASHELCKVPLGPRIHAQNKADPSAFRALLCRPPAGRWTCSIADSGQIHTAPFAVVNHGPGIYSVRFERVTVRTSAEEYRRLDDAIAALMAAGFSKQDIADGPMSSRLVALGDAGIALWRLHQPTFQPYRGGHLLDLALFLARKETATDEPRSTRTDDRPAATGGTVDDRRHEHHRSPAGPGDVAVGINRRDLADGLVAQGPHRPRDGGPIQRSLFGDDLDHGQEAPDRGPARSKRRRNPADRP